MKADKIIEKFGLRQPCKFRRENPPSEEIAQKMDEECIQNFVKGDPSGRAKYLEWMLYQAGGGKAKYDRSVQQWEGGTFGEDPVSEILHKEWVRSHMAGYIDDAGKPVPPKTEAQAEQNWRDNEDLLRKQHVFGDEDYTQYGGFGFARFWPGKNGFYEFIVSTVQRFHKHQAVLRAQGKSTDLSLRNYPNLSDLLAAMKEIVAAELKADMDYDTVYIDDYVAVVCPYNVGASLKFGIPKWCTSNESNFLQALAGQGVNRWHEYASHCGLYYCRFKQMGEKGFPVNYCAVQIDWNKKQGVDTATYWDADDKETPLAGWLTKMSHNPMVVEAHVLSFKEAVEAIRLHYSTFDRGRVRTAYTA